jgi:hypothetical protein
VSDTSREDPSTPTGVEVNDETDTVDGIESALVNLADEMSELIEAGPVDDRVALHDYAVSLVRDRLPVMRPAEVRGQDGEELEGAGSADSSELRTQTSGTTGASLVGYGVLLIPVGAILLLLFPGMGVVLVAVGVFMVLSGAIFGVLSKFTPSRHGS